VSSIVIQGQLQPIGLFNLAQVLANAAVTGVLRIYQHSLIFSIYFAQGSIVAAGAPGLEPLGEQLVRKRRLSRAQLDRVLALQRLLRQRGWDPALGQMLLQQGAVTEKDLEDCVFDQVLETVCLAQELPDPYFSFARLKMLSLTRMTVSIDFQQVLLEAVRVSDEIRRNTHTAYSSQPPTSSEHTSGAGPVSAGSERVHRSISSMAKSGQRRSHSRQAVQASGSTT